MKQNGYIESNPNYIDSRFSGFDNLSSSYVYYFSYAPTEYTEDVSSSFKKEENRIHPGVEKYRYERGNPTKFNFELLLDAPIRFDIKDKYYTPGFQAINIVNETTTYKDNPGQNLSISEFLQTLFDLQKGFFGNNVDPSTPLKLGGIITPSVLGYITNIQVQTMIHDQLDGSITRAKVKIEFTEKPIKQTWLNAQGKPLNYFLPSKFSNKKVINWKPTISAKKLKVNHIPFTKYDY